MLSKLKWIVGVAALALALMLPGGALAKSHHGNHCGRGHARHSRSVGKSCHKARHGSSSQSGTVGTSNTAADQNNQAGDQNEANDEQNEAADDQNEATEE